ncbi:MAG: NAD-dependent epimerase/dehydratase family protein [Pirellulaceae bacterium]
MRILVTGCCGFVGSRLLASLTRFRTEGRAEIELLGMDNISRPGSELNRQLAQSHCQRFWHGDLRMASDLEPLPRVDWVIDASANPSVLAGGAGQATSRQLMENNLLATLNLLEFCKQHQAGFVLISSSRVYSVPAMRQIRLQAVDDQLKPQADELGRGYSAEGLTEEFSTEPPLSLYGASKLASETLALEYAAAFGFPIWVDRCGLLAGAGQFGRSDQGIVAFWIHSWFERRPLRYIGFEGLGRQVRDCLHPEDLAELIWLQMTHRPGTARRVFNVAGGSSHRFSLAELSRWCAARWGQRDVGREPADRPGDVPWLILDSRPAREAFAWQPRISRHEIFEQIAQHAEQHPQWTQCAVD